ncbi:AbrB family transcriptional regulator [Candidatus Woesearchaeota archaeon]|nr:AbrB family transcriptional regulator [Candidatus Woesearchaeota archaeon]|tara:strand:+ start:429 stop:635 length:207 start_codon:yes stop_codon:yes gene_type:complete
MTTLTQKSQVTIPKQFRTALGVKPGDEVDFEMEHGKVVLLKKPKKLPFDKWKGRLGRFKTDDIMKELR